MFNLFNDTDQIDEFVKQHSMAVIATVDNAGQPSTSTIFYTIDKKGILNFITKDQTVKSKNLKSNNKASLTILDKTKPIAVNLMGTASEITDDIDKDTILQNIFKLSYEQLHDYAPIIKLHKGGFSVFAFEPSQAILTDFTKPIGQAKELTKKY